MGIQLSQQKNNIKKNLVVVVLCAGEGKRFQEITHEIPKPLIKLETLNNIPLLQYTLNNLVSEGILKDEYKANARFFKINKNFPLFKELKNIIF